MKTTIGLSGAFLVDKPKDWSSFGVVDRIKKSLSKTTGLQKLKVGHGGTLDPFATGLLVVLIGDASKLARYFLGSTKGYEGIFRFGQTTLSGDPTEPVSASSDRLPANLEEIRRAAQGFCEAPYMQVPPMFSAKKHRGTPLYELARQNIEIERKAEERILHEFVIDQFDSPRCHVRMRCSSGTYIRVLAQDLGRKLSSVGMVETLSRTQSGFFHLDDAGSLEEIVDSIEKQDWRDHLFWVDFDDLLRSYARTDITLDQARALLRGQQRNLLHLLPRPQGQPITPLYCGGKLIAVASATQIGWKLDRVFPRNLSHP